MHDQALLILNLFNFQAFLWTSKMQGQHYRTVKAQGFETGEWQL